MQVNYFFLTQNSAKKAHNGKSKNISKIDTIITYFAQFWCESLQLNDRLCF